MLFWTNRFCIQNTLRKLGSHKHQIHFSLQIQITSYSITQCSNGTKNRKKRIKKSSSLKKSASWFKTIKKSNGNRATCLKVLSKYSQLSSILSGNQKFLRIFGIFELRKVICKEKWNLALKNTSNYWSIRMIEFWIKGSWLYRQKRQIDKWEGTIIF